MSSRKVKRSGKHNMQLRQQRFNESMLRQFSISFIGAEKCNIIKSKDGQLINADLKLIQLFTKFPYKWSVYIAVFYRDQHGKDYMKSELAILPDYRYQADISEALCDLHMDLAKRGNEKHFVNVGWMASPTGHQWSEEEAASVFDKLGAWSTLAQWEAEEA